MAYRDAFDSAVKVNIVGDAAAATALQNKSVEEAAEELSPRPAEASHPLSVTVEVPYKGGSFILRFLLMLKLNVISVEGSGTSRAQEVLAGLFAHDDGSHSPNPANTQWLTSKSLSWDESLPGRTPILAY